MDVNNVINSSLGIVERLEDTINSISKYIELNIAEDVSREYLLERTKELKQLEKIISNSFNPLEISDNAKVSGITFKSKIYELGIAAEIVRLRENGATINEIAKSFSLDHSVISRFLKHFDTLSKVSKAKIKTESVMNTTERLEDLMSMILRQLHRLEGVDDEVHVKYIGELRQTLGLAAQISEKITTYQSYQDFMHKVKELLISELPERRLEIIGKLKALQEDPILKALPMPSSR
jgi:hypothetical protein